jgi:uncharacterized protein (DUF427 family)
VARRVHPDEHLDELRWEPFPRWVRGVRGGEAVVDSRDVVLVWLPGRRVPVYAFPAADVSGVAAQPVEELDGRVTVPWDAVERWLEEDEEVIVHPRDPHKRVDVVRSSRHVVVSVGGAVVADSRRAVALFETGLRTRWYLPVADVRMELLAPSETHTACPYKGLASYWSVGDERDVAWTYPEPLAAVAPIRGRVCFYDERVELLVDGERA